MCAADFVSHSLQAKVANMFSLSDRNVSSVPHLHSNFILFLTELWYHARILKRLQHVMPPHKK